MRCLMEAQMRSEMELAHAPQLAKLKRYENALRGISTCATACTCCQMLNGIATEALEGKE